MVKIFRSEYIVIFTVLAPEKVPYNLCVENEIQFTNKDSIIIENMMLLFIKDV